MALKNFKLTHDDGTETFVQIDPDDEQAGKAIYQSYKDAVKNDDHTLKSISEGDPAPINKGSSK
jgi:hypothetical protein